MTPTEPAVRREWPVRLGVIAAVLFFVAFVLFLLLAFEAFHGKAINKAEWLGFASTALGLFFSVL